VIVFQEVVKLFICVTYLIFFLPVPLIPSWWVLYRALCLCTMLSHFLVSSLSDLGHSLALLNSAATTAHTFFLEADVIAENNNPCYAFWQIIEDSTLGNNFVHEHFQYECCLKIC